MFLVLLLLTICPLEAQNTEGSRCNLAVYVTGWNGLQNPRIISPSIRKIAQNTAIPILTDKGNCWIIKRSSEFLKLMKKAEKTLQPLEELNDTLVAELGALYGAQKICCINIVKFENVLHVDIFMLDVATKTYSDYVEVGEENCNGKRTIRSAIEAAINKMPCIATTQISH